MHLHLRTLIGVATALMVTLVAAVTIVVATSLAFGTINANGRSAVATQCRAAVASADLIFSRPREAVVAISTLPDRYDGNHFPSLDNLSAAGPDRPDGPAADRYLLEVLGHQLRSGFDWFWGSVFLNDGSTLGCGYIPLMFNSAAKLSFVPRRGGSRTSIIRPVDARTGKHVIDNAVKFAFSLIPFPDIRTPAVREHYSSLLTNTTADRPFWSPTQLSVVKGVFFVSLSCLAYVRLDGDPIGIVTLSMGLHKMGVMLANAKATPGSHAFAVDQDGFLVASTAADARYSHDFNISRTHVVGPGCTATMATRDLLPPTGIPEDGMTCRDHISTAKVMGGQVAAAAAAFPTIVTEALDSLDGGPVIREDKARFIAAQRLPSLADNAGPTIPGQGGVFRVAVLVIIPRSDVLGSADEIIPRASLITGCIVVLVASAAFSMVWVVLRPLQPIAERMGKAARLEDDDPPPSRSWLAEICDLQAAFDEMAAELHRVRSFVPQSLLRADSIEDEEQADDSFAEESHLALPERRHASSVTLGSGLTLSNSESGHTSCSRSHSSVAPGAVNRRTRTADGVTAANISVLAVNLRGFHAAIAGKAPPGAPWQPSALDHDALGVTVAAVLAAATAQKGVVDSFHGDRFMVSFNASRPAAGHAARAARAAAALADSLATAGLQLPPTQGIASGPALVGNVGCAGLKRFAAIGSVVPRAAALERLCKLYDGATCLVPQRLFADLSTAVRLQTVDLVRLPGVPDPTLIAAVVSELDSCEAGEQDEWMYQLRVGENSIKDDTAVAALVYEAWLTLLAGDRAAAEAKVAAAMEKMTAQHDNSSPPLDAVSVHAVADALRRVKMSTGELSLPSVAAADHGKFFRETVAGTVR